MTNGWRHVIAVICALSATACRNEDRMTMQVPALDDITPTQWAQLGAQRIFFGHQSVGGNVLDGVRTVLAERSMIPLRVVEMGVAGELSRPGLYHAAIGRNGEPASKLRAFRDIVAAGFGDAGIALMKYCYVDITLATDPEALFAEYRATVDALRTQHPRLTIVHVTLPLLADAGPLRHAAAVVRGLPSGRDLNAIRHRYNELLRQRYGGREPIFDLARLESIRPDGRAAAVRYRGTTVPVLATEWTDDGGHLNDAGQRRIAEAFLVSLASLYTDGASAP